jgi:hypothetical protein
MLIRRLVGRVRVHHVCESGLEVKAACISHNCSIMRFESLLHLRPFLQGLWSVSDSWWSAMPSVNKMASYIDIYTHM